MELHHNTAQLMAESVAPSTKAVYDSALSTYKRYCLLSLGYTGLVAALPPISEDILMNFATHCHINLGLAHSTIKLYMCGLRFNYLINGLDNPFGTDMPRLHLLLRGIRRNDSKPQRLRLPITGQVLSQLISTLQRGVHGAFTDVMLQAVCTTAFFGFLRCAEFTCGDHFDPDVNLCVSDVRFQKDSACLQLKQSKTDPFRKGVTIRLFCNGTACCPTCHLHTYSLTRNKHVPPRSDMDPFFVTEGGQPLARRAFLFLLKDTFLAANIVFDHYTGHSFRIGAATSSSATSRIGDHMIKTLGRWSSDSYCRYIRTTGSAIQAAQLALASTCSNKTSDFLQPE